MRIEGSRVIVAADVPTFGPAIRLADQVGKEVAAFKVGNQLASAAGSRQAVAALAAAGCRVFRDGKWVDIPNTVAETVKAEMQAGLTMFNVMCLGGKTMMAAAKQAAVEKASELGIQTPLVLGVTVLTSLKHEDLQSVGYFPSDLVFPEVEQKEAMQRLVRRLALLAQEAGLDGVIASVQEAAMIRAACGKDFLIVTPGIRGKNDPPDDQKRTMTAGEAIAAGADFLVIGRPITKAADPAAAVKAFNDEIGEALAACGLVNHLAG